MVILMSTDACNRRTGGDLVYKRSVRGFEWMGNKSQPFEIKQVEGMYTYKPPMNAPLERGVWRPTFDISCSLQ